MDANTIRSSKTLSFVKCLALLACFYMGLKLIELFFLDSLTAEGARAIVPPNRARNEAALAHRLLVLALFVVSQLVGGGLLRDLIVPAARSWGERVKSVGIFSGVFFMITAIGVIAIIWIH